MPNELGSDECGNAFGGVGLAQLLQQQMRLFGRDVAIESGQHNFTFRELHLKALGLVQEIRKHFIRKEEPIGILSPPGIDHILSQVAIVYAGGSCVPLDSNLPDHHLRGLLQNLGASLILTDSANDFRIPGFKRIVVKHAAIEAIANDFEELEISNNDLMCRSHVFHTSGSTGKPKAVQVLANGVINLVFNEFHPVGRGQRLAHVCNIAFDVSLWEIWTGLLQGATIVIFRRNDVLDPWILYQRLQRDRIDAMWQTTSLLAATAHSCPQAYSSVDTLLTGGEAINLQTIRTIFAKGRPRRLLNVYGPTELTVFATWHEVSVEDVQNDCIPIGKPLTNYSVFVVDEDLQEVEDGTIGELLVGGAGVTAGYFGNPEKTSIAFVSAPHLSSNCKSSTGRFYRTGDLVRRNEAGLIEYLGRRDSLVKIHGSRVELDSVERCLLQTEFVSTAVALKVGPEELQDTILLAYVVPVAAEVTSEAIIQRYIKLAPQLMVPRLKMVERVTLTGSGKIDRKGLVREYIEELRRMRASLNGNSNGTINGHADTEGQLRNIWLEILGLPNTLSLQGNDDFFSLGGTSLQATLLLSKIQQSLNVAVRVAALFENPTLNMMCRLVTQTRDGVGVRDSTAEMATWLQDSQLGSDIKPIAGAVPDWRDKSEGKVFCTGATGFVGSFFLSALLAMPQVKKVACLVRAKDSTQGLLRIQQALAQYKIDLGPEVTKIIAVPGDFAQEDLGLGWERYEHFASWSSVVFHLGAQVHFLQPYSSHRAANVLGTLNLIRFANTGRLKSLHYTSTISVYGPTGLITGATYLAEDEKPASHIAAVAYDTGYAQSESVAESIAWNAIQNGLPITIHRLGFVFGHSKTGIANTDDFYGRLIPACFQVGCYPLLPGHREDFVPVDFVVSAILHIASGKEHGQAYNFVHPNAVSANNLCMIFESINRLGGFSMRGIPYAEWIQVVSKAPDSPLQPLMPMLVEKVWRSRSRWEMHENMPQFGIDNLRRTLVDAPELLNCPSVSSLLTKYVPHWKCSSL